MIDDFLQRTLAQVDDLAELKVSLVALRLLELKQSETASVTARELITQPALRDGLGIAPEIALHAALQRAIARGTLLGVDAGSLDETRYFHNNEASRRLIEALEMAENHHEASRSNDTQRGFDHVLSIVTRDIEWLESIEAYSPSSADEQILEEWLAQGYTPEAIVRSIREALHTPRPRGTPPRPLSSCAQQVTAQPPEEPTSYYRSVIARSEPPPDEVVAFRELAGRWPNGREYNLIQAAVSLYSSGSVIDTLKRLVTRQRADVHSLLPLLAEREQVEIALAHAQIQPDLMVRTLIQLYETTFGLPPTSRIANEITELTETVKDIEVWQNVFRYAATQNKREWNYVRKLLLNPSPAIFEPAPVNEIAQFAFQLYKRRVSRGVLDLFVAREINELALQITDQNRWTNAVDKAAQANALRWDYIKKTLLGPSRKAGSEDRNGKRRQGTGTRRGGVSRRPQVGEPTEEELEASRARARKRIEERTRRDTPNRRNGAHD